MAETWAPRPHLRASWIKITEKAVQSGCGSIQGAGPGRAAVARAGTVRWAWARHAGAHPMTRAGRAIRRLLAVTSSRALGTTCPEVVGGTMLNSASADFVVGHLPLHGCAPRRGIARRDIRRSPAKGPGIGQFEGTGGPFPRGLTAR